MRIDRELIRDYIEDFKRRTEVRPEYVPEGVRFPIVWFGDSEAYFDEGNPRRIVTVGLNPSHEEFAETRFSHVDLQAGDAGEQLAAALDGYFRTQENPYWNPHWMWFGKYRKLLPMLGGSYEEGTSRAVHIDLFSAIATDPTWSGLSESQRDTIRNTKLFRRLLENLGPELVVFSGADGVLREEFGDFREVESYHDVEKRAYLKLLVRDADGTKMLFGTNTSIGPFGWADGELLEAKIREWGLGR